MYICNMNNNEDLKPLLIDLEADNTATGGKQEDSVQPERLSGEDNIYVVYWIHLKDQNDILKEGYVGITLDFKSRMKSHKKSKRTTHFNYAKLKYGWNNLIIDIIHNNINLKDALFLEKYYRPIENIGWNNQIGGNIGVEKEWYSNDQNRIKHSINTSKATIKGILKNDSTENRSKRAVLSRINNKDSYKNLNKGSKNPKAILNEEQVINIKFNLLNKFSNNEIADMYNIKSYVIQFIRSGKTWKNIVCDSPAHE